MVTVVRGDIEFGPDPARVVTKPLLFGEPGFDDRTRIEQITDRVLALSEAETTEVLERTDGSFAERHRELPAIWEENAATAASYVPAIDEIRGERRSLLGAYFTQEYAPQAAAICNPSMVPVSEPGGDGSFVMSLRAIGEGHVSSVEFRSGHVDGGGSVHIDPPTRYLSRGRRQTPDYENKIFFDKLIAINADPMLTGIVMDRLSDRFTFPELEAAVDLMLRGDVSEAAAFETSRLIHWLATSNYELVFPGDMPISERILLPAGPADSRGIEDARFVRFVDTDGTVSYYATYTAFDGFTILPQLIETDDFTTFRFATLDGACARNKGMALFPRRVAGLYTALGRHDQENLHVLQSDRLRVWDHAELAYSPRHWWESIQLGNCGPPMETPHGWLVLTHGVGPMRTYAIGALLLDLEEPSRVIGQLEEPLLEPAPDERDGYVPNVVYSCGGMIHAGRLVIPYGLSDRAIRVATVSLDELVGEMT